MTLHPAFRLLASSLVLMATLAACGKSQAPAESTAAPAAAPAAQQAPAAATAAAPAADAGAQQPAATAISPADAPPPQGPAPVAGRDYVEIPNGAAFAPEAGKIEVAEVFGYTCPHCAQFEPLFEGWRRRQPSDVKITLIAAPFGGYWLPYAKAYYAAETLGLVEKTHMAMFRAIHIERSLPVQPLPSDQQLGAFYARFGADPSQFASTMASFAVDAKMKRAMQFMQRSGVDSTPTLVIAGKYRVGVNEAVTTHEEMLRVAEHLIARERAAMGGAAAGASGG